jgi:hypothetical protein
MKKYFNFCLVIAVLFLSACSKNEFGQKVVINQGVSSLNYFEVEDFIIGSFVDGNVTIDTSLLFPRLLSGFFDDNGSLGISSIDVATDSTAIFVTFTRTFGSLTEEFGIFFGIEDVNVTYLTAPEIRHLIDGVALDSTFTARGPKIYAKCVGGPCTSCTIRLIGGFWGLFGGGSYLACHCNSTEPEGICNMEIGIEIGF